MQLLLTFLVAVLFAVALAAALLLPRRAQHGTARTSRARLRQATPAAAPAARCRFQVGRAYWCRDAGWGDTAHDVLRRTPRKVLIGCDIICKRSDVTVWRTVKVVDGVEVLERGKIRADDEYTGKRGYGDLYAAAKGV